MSTHSFRRRSSLHSIVSGGRIEPQRRSDRQTVLAAELLEVRTLLTGLAWSSGPAAPAALGNAAALDIGSGVLFLGGTTSTAGTTTPRNVYLFDPDANAWTSAASTDQGRNAGGVGRTGSWGPIVTDNEGTHYKYASDIFQFGGANQGHATATATSYDPNPDGDVTTAPAMSTAHYRLACATDAVTGDLYAIGGLSSSGVALASVGAMIRRSMRGQPSLPCPRRTTARRPPAMGPAIFWCSAVTIASAPRSTRYTAIRSPTTRGPA